MNKKIIALLSTFSILAIKSAFAQSAIQIPPDRDFTLTLNFGDSLTVAPEGYINVTAGDAVVASGGASFVTNRGSLITTYFSIDYGTKGIYLAGTSGAITNSGTISATPSSNTFSAYGIVLAGTSGAITNSGIINATSSSSTYNANGIYLSGTSGAMTNAAGGSITATNYGILMRGGGLP